MTGACGDCPTLEWNGYRGLHSSTATRYSGKPSPSRRRHPGVDAGNDGRPVGDGSGRPGSGLINSFACPLDRHRIYGSGHGAELRNPRRILSPGGLWPRERRPQSAARGRGFRAAVRHGDHHRPMAADQRRLCRGGARSRDDRRYLCSAAGAGLVCFASTGDHIGYGANLPPPASSKTQSDDDTRSLRRHPIASTRKAAETARRKLASCGRGFHNLVYWIVDGAMGSNRRS